MSLQNLATGHLDVCCSFSTVVSACSSNTRRPLTFLDLVLRNKSTILTSTSPSTWRGFSRLFSVILLCALQIMRTNTLACSLRPSAVVRVQITNMRLMTCIIKGRGKHSSIKMAPGSKTACIARWQAHRPVWLSSCEPVDKSNFRAAKQRLAISHLIHVEVCVAY